jgi:serine/threonine protein kinase/class 3 adenylate cyclase
VRVLHAVALSLIDAHRVGLCHGRLTPENIGWTAPLADHRAVCSLDFTRCPENLRADSTVDVWQLSQLWVWMLGMPVPEVPGAATEVCRLFLEMQSAEPSDRPAADAIAQALQGWLRQQASAADDLGRTFIGSSEATPIPEESPAEAAADRAAPTPHGEAESTPTTATDPIAGRRTLGRFKLLAKLGEGGMGAVWRAEDPVDGRMVAIKVLRADMAQKEILRKRFLREARLLAEVNNPYVANMLEVNAEGDVNYFVLEFVDGSNLLEYLKERGRLSERVAVAIAADVARALRDAHERGIVHRDLKPENILLCDDRRASSTQPAAEFPRVKLTDFGLARHVAESQSMHLTSAGTILGTPLYFAPEQCSGKAEVDVRADVYSLGATLFHALAGRPPFESDSVIKLITRHVNEPAPRLRSLVPELSEAIDEIVAKCLQKSPAARYQDSGGMLRDLERLLRGEPTGIVAHPRLPAADYNDVLAFDFSWELKNPPHALWPHVSNTERLNRAVGLPAVDFSAEPDPDGGSRRFGQFRKFGMAIGWQEHPFEWIEGRRMGVLREFKQGPWKWFTSVVEMTPHSDGGTTLMHRIRILPANLMGTMAARLEVGLKSRKSLEKIYHHIDAVLSGELGTMADPFESAHRLSAEGGRLLEQRLQAVIERGAEPFVVERFGEFLAEAPVQELARIRPLALAKRLSLDEQQLLAACLVGTSQGLLTMLWDIICPICRIPSQVMNSLKAIKEHGRCEACQSDFELDFANSIELIFRIASDIQSTETGVYCIGGPAHSPHVVAQVRLAPAERFELDLELTEGTYRVRGPQLPYVIDFRAAPNALAARWELSLANGPLDELPRQLKPGPQLFVFVNDTPHEILARIERTASRSDAFTAARAAATPLFRDLFPGECLAPDQLVQVEQVTLLFTRLDHAQDLYEELGDSPAFRRMHEHFRRLESLIRREGGSLFKTVGEGACAVFTEPVMAIRAALAIRQLDEPDLRVAVHRGPAMVATINDHLDYFGSTVNATFHLLDALPAAAATLGPRVVVSDSIARDPQVVAAVSGVQRHAQLKPSSHSSNGIYAHELVERGV